MMRLRVLFVVTLVCMTGPAGALTPEETGLQIAEETERRDAGFVNFASGAVMILKNAQGEESERNFRRVVLEQSEDGDKTLLVFDKPADLKGTAILTFAHALTPDDQWLYLPSVKRVKRIASQNKSGLFLGSEFSYEDLGAWEVKKYTYRWLRDEDYEGAKCFVIENTPAYPDSGYSKQIEWVDQTMYQPRKLEFYDRGGVLLKTLYFKDYKQYLGQYWRPGELLMHNHQTNKSTRIVWLDYQFKTKAVERDFTPEALSRN